jgi:hypothetical protein
MPRAAGLSRRGRLAATLKPSATLALAAAIGLSCGGCVAITVAGAAVSVAGTVVGVGVSAGSAVVSTAGAVASGVIGAGSAMVGGSN